MSQKPTRARNLGLAALLVTGTVFSGAAHAQSATFNYVAPDGSGSHLYGLLNGQHVALYINDRGDLGAPYPIIGGNPGGKPPSLINPITGRPLVGNIGANGQILPINNPPSYAALFSQTSTAGLSIGDSVKAKSEFIGGGLSPLIEGFSIYANNGLLPGTRFLRDSELNVNSFTTSGTSATGSLSAVSNLSTDLLFRSGNGGTLGIEQNVSFQPGNNVPNNRVQFTTTFTNTSSETLQSLRYARVVDVNTGFGNPSTTQRFLTPADPDAFALTSSVGSNALGIGVFDGSSPFNEPGSILFTADTTLGEGTLLQSPFDRATTYVELIGGNGAAIKQKVGGDLDTSDDTVLFSTSNFIGDAAFRDQVATTLALGNNSNASLMLLSPALDIAPNQSANFTFFYFFGGQVGGSVPEPGTLALFAAGGLSGLWLRRKKRQ